MAPSSRSQKPASFSTQANALLRKNLTFEKRNIKSHLCLAMFPIIICILLATLQIVIKVVMKKNGVVQCPTCVGSDCGVRFYNDKQIDDCPVGSFPSYPPVLKLPQCMELEDPCSVTALVTGGNQSFGERLAENLYNKGYFDDSSSSDGLSFLSNFYLGSPEFKPTSGDYVNPTFGENEPLYSIQPECSPNSTFNVTIDLGFKKYEKDVRCLPGVNLWRTSSKAMKDDIVKSYFKENNEIIGAYDFLNSGEKVFNVSILYNLTNAEDTPSLVNPPSLLNAVSSSYLQLVGGADLKILFDFVKAMPRPSRNNLEIDFLSSSAPLLFTWVILQLFPVILASLVYEKQRKLRIMMKMQGLANGPYWVISYAYFLFVSMIYMLCLVVFGCAIGLRFFVANSYSIQFAFYFIYINLQIAHAILVSTCFSNTKVATVTGHLYALGSGLVGYFFLANLITSTSFPSFGLILLEILPCFSLYRGMWELSDSSYWPDGMQWKDISTNGMRQVLVIMLLEWVVFLLTARYLDQVVATGSGTKKHPLFFLKNFQRKSSPSFPRTSPQESVVSVNMENHDVSQERKKVENVLTEPGMDYAIVCDNLKKIYPGKDGNPEKYAVRGLSLAVPRGECFGMLGPNGAGKTSSISMMIGFMAPTSGTAFIHGLDIRTDMDKIYTTMGVCPQHDLLWETLTGREHLLFYGRLKNLKGEALTQAVEESLKSVSLFDGGVADKRAGKYSGGMKRRLSVAIALIGNPKVVYMDEPSTGLDPASRKILWDAVKRAKENCAIILTTHSMEEAEILCDRVGIYVDGSMQCIGCPTELKARYGGAYVFTMTTSSNHEKEVERMVLGLCPNANKVYNLSGTQKFEIPKNMVRIADVFHAVEIAKRKFTVHAWGLADTTLEDVFIKVARDSQCSIPLS
ncbi:hypothetical protein ACHQM5_005255 [Ranunculus cassubicifolius]